MFSHWTETDFQLFVTGALGVEFVLLGILNFLLFKVLVVRENPTRLGRSMIVKYAAWVIAGPLLAALQAYSFYFLMTKSVGFFTYEVRNGIRLAAVVGLAVVLFSMANMYLELRKAERQIGENPISE